MKYAWQRSLEYWKAYWYIRTAITFVIIILSLGILVQILKEIPCLAGTIWYTSATAIYDFFNDWSLVLSAGVTLMLAVAAIWAVMDNRYGRRLDRMQRLQDDVINWAFEVRKTLFVPCFERQTVIQADMREKLDALAAKRSIIEAKAAELSVHAELTEKVGEVANHLEQFINNLEHVSVQDFDSLKTPWENLKKEFLEIVKSASSIKIPELK